MGKVWCRSKTDWNIETYEDKIPIPICRYRRKLFSLLQFEERILMLLNKDGPWKFNTWTRTSKIVTCTQARIRPIHNSNERKNLHIPSSFILRDNRLECTLRRRESVADGPEMDWCHREGEKMLSNSRDIKGGFADRHLKTRRTFEKGRKWPRVHANKIFSIEQSRIGMKGRQKYCLHFFSLLCHVTVTSRPVFLHLFPQRKKRQ